MHISIGFGLVRFLDLCVLHEDLIDVRAGVLVQFLVGADDNERHVNITENTQLVGLLQETVLPLAKGYL